MICLLLRTYNNLNKIFNNQETLNFILACSFTRIKLFLQYCKTVEVAFSDFFRYFEQQSKMTKIDFFRSRNCSTRVRRSNLRSSLLRRNRKLRRRKETAKSCRKFEKDVQVSKKKIMCLRENSTLKKWFCY